MALGAAEDNSKGKEKMYCLGWSSCTSFNELEFGPEKKEIIKLKIKLTVFSEDLGLLAAFSNVLSGPQSFPVVSCNSASFGEKFWAYQEVMRPLPCACGDHQRSETDVGLCNPNIGSLA